MLIGHDFVQAETKYRREKLSRFFPEDTRRRSAIHAVIKRRRVSKLKAKEAWTG